MLISIISSASWTLHPPAPPPPLSLSFLLLRHPPPPPPQPLYLSICCTFFPRHRSCGFQQAFGFPEPRLPVSDSREDAAAVLPGQPALHRGRHDGSGVQVPLLQRCLLQPVSTSHRLHHEVRLIGYSFYKEPHCSKFQRATDYIMRYV